MGKMTLRSVNIILTESFLYIYLYLFNNEHNLTSKHFIWFFVTVLYISQDPLKCYNGKTIESEKFDE